MDKELFLILHNIRSAYNVGAIFRTADGAGVSKIYLGGYTPCPPDEKKKYITKADKMIEKTALGAEKTVPWEKYEKEKPGRAFSLETLVLQSHTKALSPTFRRQPLRLGPQARPPNTPAGHLTS